MGVMVDFVRNHWLFLALLVGSAGAVAFVWSHKQRLFYNKPEP
jgi:hypothetical protein